MPLAAAPKAADARRTRVLILSEDPVREKMAGPAIRCWHMAHELAKSCEVRLVSWRPIERTAHGFSLGYVHPDDDAAMREHEAWMDVVIVQGVGFRQFPCIAATDKIVVADLYDPFHLEQLEHKKHLPAAQWADEVRKAVTLLDEQLARADVLLCASERQRDLWLGALSALGRINPLTYAVDPTLSSLVRIVPFGLPDTPAEQTRHAIKGTVQGIGPDDKVLIWGGGIYEWFDPITLVEAVSLVTTTHPEVKLFFLSAQHFDKTVAAMRVVASTRARSDELGLTGRNVFFNDTWVAYDDRINFLLDADLGVSTHQLHAETRFSFRTRILDYLWAGLPIITTEGDTFADIVVREGLGAVVPARNPAALADAIIRLLFEGDVATAAAQSVARVRPEFAWERTLAPLRAYCDAPVPAPDRGQRGLMLSSGATEFDRILAMPRGRARDLRLLVYYLRRGGPKLLWSKIRERTERSSL